MNEGDEMNLTDKEIGITNYAFATAGVILSSLSQFVVGIAILLLNPGTLSTDAVAYLFVFYISIPSIVLVFSFIYRMFKLFKLKEAEEQK